MAGKFSTALQHSEQIDITVTGRVTGRHFTFPVWFAEEGRKLYLVPVTGSDSDWYKNVLTTPPMELTADGESIAVTAAPMTDPGRVQTIVEKFREKYGAGQIAEYYPKTDVAVEITLPSEAN
jgi:hypothetical protein